MIHSTYNNNNNIHYSIAIAAMYALHVRARGSFCRAVKAIDRTARPTARSTFDPVCCCRSRPFSSAIAAALYGVPANSHQRCICLRRRHGAHSWRQTVAYRKVHIYRRYRRAYINPRTYVSPARDAKCVSTHCHVSGRSFVKFSDLFTVPLFCRTHDLSIGFTSIADESTIRSRNSMLASDAFSK